MNIVITLQIWQFVRISITAMDPMVPADVFLLLEELGGGCFILTSRV